MYPNELFLGVTLYDIFLGIGVIMVLVCLRFGFDRLGIRSKLFNMCLLIAIASVLIGYGFAVLFQAFYNYMASGIFRIDLNTGATFYGGLIGGVITVMIGYFLVGRFLFPDGYHKTQIFRALSVGALCVTVCHAFGRIGCLTAGCCYGHDTDAWYGIYMVTTGTRVVPTQLFESIFLFLLSGLLFYKIFVRKPQYNLPIYMVSYGVWRFCIEFVRNDYRGQSLIPGLSPSQLIAILMAVGGVGVFFLERALRSRGHVQ